MAVASHGTSPAQFSTRLPTTLSTHSSLCHADPRNPGLVPRLPLALQALVPDYITITSLYNPYPVRQRGETGVTIAESVREKASP